MSLPAKHDALFPMKATGPEALTAARYSSTHAVELPLSPEQVFRIWANAETWSQWAPGMVAAPWDSAEPPAEGCGRTVELADGSVFHEHFYCWDAPREMGFAVDSASNPLFSVLAEHFVLTPTETGCRLEWTLAYTPERFARWLHPWIRPVVKLALGRVLKRFQAFCVGLERARQQRG